MTGHDLKKFLRLRKEKIEDEEREEEGKDYREVEESKKNVLRVPKKIADEHRAARARAEGGNGEK